MAVTALAVPTAVQAAPPDFLTRLTAGEGSSGSGAGRVDNPRGVAADPETGHVYVADLNNARVDVFTAWGHFVRAWGWGVADGGEELQSCGPAEPAIAPAPELCQKGLEGEGKGQFSLPAGVAVDGAGDVYVVDFNFSGARVQKFSPSGEFILMFGGEVNKTTLGDVCAEASGHECGKGTSGADPGHFTLSSVQDYIAYSATANAILVGDKDRIQIFNLDGTYREEIGFDVPGPLEALDGKTVNGLDVDGAGNIYISLAGTEDVFKLSVAGTPLAPGAPGSSKFKAQVPLGVAIDVEGAVYVIDNPPNIAPNSEARILKYDAAGNLLVPTAPEAEAERFFPYIPSGPFGGPALNGIATNHCAGSEDPGNLYATAFGSGESWVDAYGTPPSGCEDPPERPPHILDQYASQVGTETATLQAEINPRFWADTAYYVEYGVGPCPAPPAECGGKAPIPPSDLTDLVIQDALKSTPVAISGLEPATTYHYRFVAESGGGGPVYGEGGGEEEKDGEAVTYREVGEEGTFTTFKSPAPKLACSNDVFRKDVGAQLPDCRAYEMVSPLDKEGGDVALWEGRGGGSPVFFELHQSASSGERFTYSSTSAFEDPDSAPFASQYLAERGGGGWSSEAIAGPMTKTAINAQKILAESEYQLFSDDLCRGWLRSFSVAPLTGDAIPGYVNAYKRENCGGLPLFEALTTGKPRNVDAQEYDQVRVHGASAAGDRVIFVANDALTDDAPSLADDDELLLYEKGPEGLRFVCYLPDGTPNAKACAPGTPAATFGGQQSSARNAISADGERIFWTAFEGSPGFGDSPGAPGRIYARIGGVETVEISGQVSGEDAWYWSAAEDGSRVVFSFGGANFNPGRSDELYEVDVDAAIAEAPGAATLIAEGVEGPMGASEDASVVYFASTEDLDAGGPAQNGPHNLYRYEAGDGGGQAYELVTELAEEDIGGLSAVDPAAIEGVPAQRSASVTPDGAHAVFTSMAPAPSGYENLDAETGEPVREVYRYDATTDELLCISCNPSGARPVGLQVGEAGLRVAARIQGWEALGRAPRVISEDGGRVFFESLEALVPRDTNGTWDVYQWEEPGKGSCSTSDATYGETSKGCVDLISSGQSPAKSTFLDADPSGDNVFFGTQSSLVGSDFGLSDVYVARVGGGFPEPAPTPECEGEACQSPPPAPEPKRPASAGHTGLGNVRPASECGAHARRARRHARAAKALRRRARRAEEKRAKAPLEQAAARHHKAAKRLAKSARRCRAATGGSSK
ncbi:MAG TPA: hypothetical protein VEQ41_07435 [Solirubrobacterales bacterium]|nr:hypothetical protein [Solirubrobacterales bacterium]